MKKHLTPKQVDKIILQICNEFCITLEQIESKDRFHNIAEARQIICYICMDINYYNRAELARSIGITPPIVNYSLKVMRNYIDTDNGYKEKIESIINNLI